MSSVLTSDELVELTQRQRSDAQARELDHLGIRYQQRRDGSLVVFWEDVRPGATIPREPRLRLANGPST